MKISKLNVKRTLISTGVALLMAQGAGAGTHYDARVYVSSYSASGNLFDARYSPDATQYIGCQLNVGANPSGDYLFCNARDASGKYFGCYVFGNSA